MLHCKILFTEGLKRIEINLKVSCLRACLHGGGGPQIGEVTCGGSPHLSCQRDQINRRDYVDRRPGYLTYLGFPPPCKQALSPQTDTIYKSPEGDLPWN